MSVGIEPRRRGVLLTNKERATVNTVAALADRPTRRGCVLVFAALTCTWAGCAVRTVLPPKPALATPTVFAGDSLVAVRTLQVKGLGVHDNAKRVERLRKRLVDYVSARPQLRVPELLSRDAARVPRFVADVRIELDQDTHRTWVLDLMMLPFWGTVVPWWGEVKASIEMVLTDESGETTTYRHKTSKDFSAVFWSWFRKGYVERAYSEAYRELFDAVVADLVDSASPVMAAVAGAEMRGCAGATPCAQGSLTDVEAPAPDTALPTTSLDARRSTQETEAASTPTPPDDARILHQRQRSPAGPWILALRAVGGVQASAFVGVARVESKVKDDSGKSVPVAAGKAHQAGWGVAIYGSLPSTGFYLAPTLGFMSQQISIADFRRTFPEAQVAGGVEIDALCSDPVTHAIVDCMAPNTYALKLQSTYGGVRAGYDFVFGTSSVAWVTSATVAINAAEYRHIEASIGHTHDVQSNWAFLRSGAVGGATGLELPHAHIALKLSFDYQYYREFAFARPLQFEGEVVYNEAKSKYERPLRDVSAAKLTAWTLQCALACVF